MNECHICIHTDLDVRLSVHVTCSTQRFISLRVSGEETLYISLKPEYSERNIMYMEGWCISDDVALTMRSGFNVLYTTPIKRAADKRIMNVIHPGEHQVQIGPVILKHGQP